MEMIAGIEQGNKIQLMHQKFTEKLAVVSKTLSILNGTFRFSFTRAIIFSNFNWLKFVIMFMNVSRCKIMCWNWLWFRLAYYHVQVVKSCLVIAIGCDMTV